jgi:hypothetical protein
VSAVGYVVVEYNQASGLPFGAVLHATLGEAGRGEQYRVAKVILIAGEG